MLIDLLNGLTSTPEKKVEGSRESFDASQLESEDFDAKLSY